MKRLLASFLLLSALFTANISIAAPLDIYVSILPQKWLLEKIGADLVRPHVLVDKGQDPHTFDPTPRQVVSLSAAKAYLTMNMQFENIMLKKLIHNNNVLTTIDVTKGIVRLPMTRDAHLHDEPHRSEDHRDHTHHDNGEHHDDMLFDPHVWLSVRNLKIMAANIAEALSSLDKTHIEQYETNLSATLQRLSTLEQELSRQLLPYKGARFYVFHPSFGYFAHEYDLEQKAVEIEGKSPSPKQLSNLIRMAKEDNIKVIFTQPQFDKRSAQAIAAAIGGHVVPLDPLAEDAENNLRQMADYLTTSFN